MKRIRAWLAWQRFRFRLWWLWRFGGKKLPKAMRDGPAKISGFAPLAKSGIKPTGIADVYEDRWPWGSA